MKLALVVLLAGCFTSPPPATPAVVGNTPAPTPKPEHHHQLTARMSRTPCMGACPTYTVEIHDDNSVIFIGQGNVGETGRHDLPKLTPANRARLIAMIDKVHYFKMREDGSIPVEPKCRDNGDGTQTCTVGDSGWGCSDTTSAILEITLDGRSHHTDNPHCHEQPLDELENLIDEVTGVTTLVNH